MGFKCYSLPIIIFYNVENGNEQRQKLEMTVKTVSKEMSNLGLELEQKKLSLRDLAIKWKEHFHW